MSAAGHVFTTEQPFRTGPSAWHPAAMSMCETVQADPLVPATLT